MTASLTNSEFLLKKNPRFLGAAKTLNPKKTTIYWYEQKSNHQCLPRGARQQQFACPAKHFLPENSSFAPWHNCAGTSFCNHTPIQGEGFTYNEPYVCGEAFWAVKRQKFLPRILQIGATGGRWGPGSIKRTWERAESWARVRREAEGRRRG